MLLENCTEDKKVNLSKERINEHIRIRQKVCYKVSRLSLEKGSGLTDASMARRTAGWHRKRTGRYAEDDNRGATKPGEAAGKP